MKARDLQQQIGLVVRTRRARQKISQEAFADKIRMHRAYHGVVERGEANFQLSTLQRVSDGLGIKLSKLIESAEEATATQSDSSVPHGAMHRA